ncbi:hypothetical protein ACA910_008061 [Epithemia clementina (nom. ined.)]
MADMEDSRHKQRHHGQEDNEYYTDNDCDSERSATLNERGLRRNNLTATDDVEPGQASPTTSSAMSVSSVPPTLVAALLQQHQAPPDGTHLPFELTPIMCNTSFGSHTTRAARTTRGGSQTAASATQSRPSIVSPLDGKHEPDLDDISQENKDVSAGNDTLPEPSLVVVDCSSVGDKEHLSLPNDLSDDPNIGSHHGAGIAPSEGLLPALRFSSGSRSQSLLVRPNPSALAQASPKKFPATRSTSLVLHSSPLKRPQDSEKMPLHNPIAFPTRKKFNSFTSRQQYENRMNASIAVELTDRSEGHYYDGGGVEEDDDDVFGLVHNYHHPQHQGLTPYQPTRPEDAMLEVPPEEELSQIFAARARFFENRSPSDGSNRSLGEKLHRLTGTTPSYPSWGAGGAANGLQTQGVDHVPTLHMAHRLSTATGTDNASMTTYTTLNTLGEEDDEDFLNTSGSHPSWSNSWHQNFSGNNASSFSSNNNNDPPLLEDPEAESDGSPQRHRRKSSETRSIVVEGLVGDELPWAQETPQRRGEVSSSRQAQGHHHRHEHSFNASGDADYGFVEGLSTDNDTAMAVDGRYQKEQEALEWIQSLQVSSKDTTTTIAEAASSKFLCSTASPVHSPDRRKKALMHHSRTASQPMLS